MDRNALQQLAVYSRKRRKHGPFGGLFASFNPHSIAALRQAGAIACARYVKLGDNPFGIGSIAYRCWNEGWHACNRHLLRQLVKTE